MEPTDTLTVMFRHNLWANQRMFERCAALTDEQLDATLTGSYGTIRDTLTHIAKAELSYFSRISTGKPYRYPDDGPPMTVAQLLESVRKTGSGFIEWANKVQAGDSVEIDWDGTLRDVPKTIILTQVINHATEHRSQIMTILTQLGIEPPNLDSWSYFDELEK